MLFQRLTTALRRLSPSPSVRDMVCSLVRRWLGLCEFSCGSHSRLREHTCIDVETALTCSWPVAKLLEYILGKHHGIIYRRSELRELIKMHAATAAGGGDLDIDTVTMAQGALDLAQKSVKEAMTPIDRVFVSPLYIRVWGRVDAQMLPIEAKLDYETLGHVVRSGHSRIPVYQMVEVPDIDLSAPRLQAAKAKLVKRVMGSLLVKSCVLLDPEGEFQHSASEMGLSIRRHALGYNPDQCDSLRAIRRAVDEHAECLPGRRVLVVRSSQRALTPRSLPHGYRLTSPASRRE